MKMDQNSGVLFPVNIAPTQTLLSGFSEPYLSHTECKAGLSVQYVC
jgi:hypothetical protein